MAADQVLPAEAGLEALAPYALLGYVLTVACFYATPQKWGADLRSRVFSTVNALILTAVGLRTVVLQWDRLISGDSALFYDVSDVIEWRAAAWTFGYFMGDVTLGVLNPGLLDTFMWVHHAVGVISSFFGCYLRPARGLHILALFLLNEISTPFVNLHHVFKEAKVQDWRRTANGLALWLAFVVFRIGGNALNTRAILTVYSGPHGAELWKDTPIGSATILLFLPLLLCLNCYWTYKITVNLLKAVGWIKSTGKGSKAVKEA